MKKLMLLAAACCFIFAACNNQPQGETTPADSTAVAEAPACDTNACQKECCEMMKAWNDWDNQTPEQKAELVAKRAAKINEILANIDEIKCENKKAEMTKFQEEWKNFESLKDVEAQKALIDKFPCCKGDKCCKGEKCCGKCNGKCECTADKNCGECKGDCKPNCEGKDCQKK